MSGELREDWQDFWGGSNNHVCENFRAGWNKAKDRFNNPDSTDALLERARENRIAFGQHYDGRAWAQGPLNKQIIKAPTLNEALRKALEE